MLASGVYWVEANRLCKLHGAILAKIILPPKPLLPRD